MAKLNMTKAAEAVGISRQKLYNDIELKGISVDRSDPKKPTIDTAELLRVYGELQGMDSSKDVKARQRLTPRNDNQIDSLQAELAELRRADREALQSRLDAVERERDEWKEQARSWQEQAERASRLLVDQRETIEPAAPAPSLTDETPAARPQDTRRGGLWAWLRGE